MFSLYCRTLELSFDVLLMDGLLYGQTGDTNYEIMMTILKDRISGFFVTLTFSS
jgi:hypothetical protein